MNPDNINYGEKYPVFENSRSNAGPYPEAIGNCVEASHVASPYYQRWMPSTNSPYPMNFSQARSPQHQILITHKGSPMLHGLSTSSGPYMYPTRVQYNRGPINSYERKHSAIVYPTTHSVPGPFLQSYINLPNKMYMY